ncbi:PhzA/PhzB family protein [Homoserinimonas sp. OAct 916]|uniref:PhzA/PhzB family protein n=1 Tax=Homoserinimonas sp. OAct 916 TaxID=2211450 RepID=UPI0013001A05|nr:PhzA/PhzB family protein [Homoserinimonas sp. OAct 916]
MRTDSNIEQERAKNRATVDKWASLLFWDEGQADLVADDAVLEFKFPSDLRPGGDQTSLKAATSSLDGVFKEWLETPIEVFDTDDPTRFIIWFRAGYGRLGDSDESLHESEFVLLYIVEDGLIKLIREYFNPLQILEAQGIGVDDVVLLKDEVEPEFPFY